jgi:hypothetical protein
MPDVASVPLNAIPTGWLYQPFASGPLLGDAPVTEGGVASRLTVTDNDAVAPPVYWRVHVKDVPVVSDET